MPHPDPDPHATSARFAGAPSDELTLAAVDRAERHRAASPMPVAIWSILEHLAVPRRSAAARHVRERLSALVAAGSLARARRGGVPTWELSSSGHARLRRARRANEVPELPESPQHRAWRNARTAAAQEIERFRARLLERLESGARLLDASPPPHSDAWLALGEDLRRDCRRLASASHCLHEWAEPADNRADLDERSDPADELLDPALAALRRGRRAGRRNIRLWDD
jgi:hypothetical protein